MAEESPVGPRDEPLTTPDGLSDNPVKANLPAAAAGRYVFLQEIARGGMGIVFSARDTVLNRDVAVKVLQERFGPDTAAARRFADEARISGQLQHPGIPPVHDLGVLPDGRAFLAMKLIKGRTLGELLKDRATLAADRGRFLAVFDQVCQAVAYAHARGVIHRDLKPANVMVGAFGEVQLMDWGLAKVLARPISPTTDEVPHTTTIFDPRADSDGSKTAAGSILGTPAFMAPEQAVGAVDRIDQRTDVFGLGAILCTVLTGAPPFVADTAEAIRILAAQGKVEHALANLAACGAEPELVALCVRCLSADPADRPPDGGAVAKEVGRLRAATEERAREAELDRVRAEGERAKAQAEAREQRKRRTRQLLLAIAIGLLMLGSGTFIWWQDRLAFLQRVEAERRDRDERERLGRNGEVVAALLGQSEAALRVEDQRDPNSFWSKPRGKQPKGEPITWRTGSRGFERTSPSSGNSTR